jgi:hypothetical protein
MLFYIYNARIATKGSVRSGCSTSMKQATPGLHLSNVMWSHVERPSRTTAYLEPINVTTKRKPIQNLSIVP